MNNMNKKAIKNTLKLRERKTITMVCAPNTKKRTSLGWKKEKITGMMSVPDKYHKWASEPPRHQQQKKRVRNWVLGVGPAGAFRRACWRRAPARRTPSRAPPRRRSRGAPPLPSRTRHTAPSSSILAVRRLCKGSETR